MAVRRGDVILTHVRFSSGPGGKVRPALVVQSDHNNQRLQDTIIALITRTTHRAQIESSQLLIEITTPEGRASGLLQTSAVKCEHLETILQADIQRTIGHLPPALMQKIDACLRSALGLP
jgi:mRNA-degrading endonuclease toxin of MazEF toxin-antitoxin module